MDKVELRDCAQYIHGFEDYCIALRRKLVGSITVFPTVYLSDVECFNKENFKDNLVAEIDLYYSYIKEHADPNEIILVKGHPSQHSSQSHILTQRLNEQGWQAVEIERYTHFPIELFAIHLDIRKVLALFSSTCVSLALICKCDVVLGASEDSIDLHFNSLWNRKFRLLEFAYYLQIKQAYRQLFYPIRCLDLSKQLSRVVASYPMYISAQDSTTSISTSNSKSKSALSLSILTELSSYYYEEGNQLRLTHALEEAAFSYRLALEFNSDSSFLHNSLGEVLIEQDRLTEVLAACTKAIEIEPNVAEFYQNLGLV